MSHNPETNLHESREKDLSTSRRAFLKLLAAAAVSGTASGMVPSSHPNQHDRHVPVARAQADMVRLAPELAEYDPVDLVGTGVFLHGVSTLARGNNINKWHYGVIAALLATKHHQATPSQKKHLESEIKSNFKALGVITGTIAIGDGLKMDLTKSCEALLGRKPDDAAQVALLNMFSTFVAPVVTTVGNASVISGTANRLAAGDKDFMAISIGHSSGRAGYLLFGDPPFLALIDKYGFREAVIWQLTRMLPLALYSLVSSTLKMNVILANRAGSPAPFATALAQTKKGLVENIPYLAKIIGSSLANAVKYFSGADLSSQAQQSPVGVEIEIGTAISTKLENLFRLPWDKSLDQASPDDFESRVADADDLAWRETVTTIVSDLHVEVTHINKAEGGGQFEDLLTNSLLKRDFVAAKKVLSEHGIGDDEAADHIENLKRLLPLVYAENGNDASKTSKLRHLIDTILKAPDRTTDFHRVKKAFGHNVGDVLNVFPFQANCVPFLLPLLQKFVHKMDTVGLSNTQKEIAIFLIVMAFSMVADNYVAVKMGLDLLPNKPQIPLIAGIEGGELTSIGNMANMAQFNSDSFSLKDSLARMHLAIDNVGIGILYALALGEASIRPQETDLVAAKDMAKGLIDQVLGNPAMEIAIQNFNLPA